MTTLMEAPHEEAMNPVAVSEVPFYSAAEVGGPQMACAAMMMHAVMGPDATRPANDEQYWRAVTGLESVSREVHGNTTVFARSWLTMYQRGLAVRLVSGIDLPAFASAGVEALPDGMAQVFATGPSNIRLETETALTGELLAHLRSGNGYRERQVSLDDVAGALEKGWVVGLHTNGHLLRGADGYASHSLVVTAVDGDKIAAHNPGGNGMDALSDQVFDPEEVGAILSDPSLIMSAVGRVRLSDIPAAKA